MAGLTGLVSNFPLFANARFGWGTTANAFFFAFVGVCAVTTQGALIGCLQPRFGETRLVLGGLAFGAANLILGPILAGLAFDHVGVTARHRTLPPRLAPRRARLAGRGEVTLGIAAGRSQRQQRVGRRKEEDLASVNSPTHNPLRIGVVVLALGTAIIHLYLGLSGIPMFVLNGLGYLALVAALFLPVPQLARYRNAVRWVLIGYTALTIVLWLLVGARTPIGYADKLIEVALICLLLIEGRHAR